MSNALPTRDAMATPDSRMGVVSKMLAGVPPPGVPDREEEVLSGRVLEEEGAAVEAGPSLPHEVEEEDNPDSFPHPILPNVSVCPEVSPVTEDPPDSPDMDNIGPREAIQ